MAVPLLTARRTLEYKELLKKSMEAALRRHQGGRSYLLLVGPTYIWLIFKPCTVNPALPTRRVAIWLKRIPKIPPWRCLAISATSHAHTAFVESPTSSRGEQFERGDEPRDDHRQQPSPRSPRLSTFGQPKRLAGNQYEHSTMKPS